MRTGASATTLGRDVRSRDPDLARSPTVGKARGGARGRGGGGTSPVQRLRRSDRRARVDPDRERPRQRGDPAVSGMRAGNWNWIRTRLVLSGLVVTTVAALAAAGGATASPTPSAVKATTYK